MEIKENHNPTIENPIFTIEKNLVLTQGTLILQYRTRVIP